jgi:DNA-binding MarR family transcriptional regulator
MRLAPEMETWEYQANDPDRVAELSSLERHVLLAVTYNPQAGINFLAELTGYPQYVVKRVCARLRSQGYIKEAW